MATSSSTAQPCVRANSTSSRTFCMTAPRSGVPATVIPRQRRSSSKPPVLKQPQRAQHGVGVDAEDGCEVSCWWESFTGFGFAVCDRTPYLGGDLEIEEVVPSSLFTLTPINVLMILAH